MKKKVLFIAPKFMGYYEEIIKEMELSGYEVDYMSDAPKDSILFKALNRINKKITIKYSEKKFLKMLKNNNEKKYDYLFLIVGMTFCIPKKFFEYIKCENENIKMFIYQWDGEKNIEFIREYHKYFDKIFTFDRIDSEKNQKYSFLPLFYINKYEKIAKKNIERFDYDISYVGTAHPQKFYFINKISDDIKIKYGNQFIYHYMPTKLKYYYHKIFNKEYKNAKINDFKYEKLSFKKIGEIFEKSRCILDAPQKGQNGLTMRTIECLGAKKKLITTNKDIKNYDFYTPENIYIYDENEGIDINNKFFNCDYCDVDKKTYDKYSLKNWIKIIFR